MKNRFTKSDWLTLGLEVLSQQGSEALTLERLCESAAKTKGSFYFHFNTIDAYLVEMIEQWLETYTTQIITRHSIKTQRLDLLNQLVTQLDLDLETGIRNLACRNKTIQELVTHADQMRLEWLAELYVNSGNYDKQQANALAAIEIAAFTGFRLNKPDMQAQEARLLYDRFLKLTNRS